MGKHIKIKPNYLSKFSIQKEISLFLFHRTVVGVGVGMSRDCSTGTSDKFISITYFNIHFFCFAVMVAQYFKRKREFVEIFIVSGSGLGIVVMSTFIKSAIEAIGWRFVLNYYYATPTPCLNPMNNIHRWTFLTIHHLINIILINRLGLQAVTICVFSTFILGTCYRSASLYHPQRRAILHLKNQKRKIKDKSKQFDGPPFFDFSTLKSKTVRILMLSTAIT